MQSEKATNNHSERNGPGKPFGIEYLEKAGETDHKIHGILPTQNLEHKNVVNEENIQPFGVFQLSEKQMVNDHMARPDLIKDHSKGLSS